MTKLNVNKRTSRIMIKGLETPSGAWLTMRTRRSKLCSMGARMKRVRNTFRRSQSPLFDNEKTDRNTERIRRSWPWTRIVYTINYCYYDEILTRFRFGIFDCFSQCSFTSFSDDRNVSDYDEDRQINFDWNHSDDQRTRVKWHNQWIRQN